MSKKKPEFTIREKELAEALKITPERLDEIIVFSTQIPTMNGIYEKMITLFTSIKVGKTVCFLNTAHLLSLSTWTP